ncbi:MAG: peptidase M28 [Flavobacterium sp. BFFFF2]|nr:MAG: peptidase M28 [Flavobacterium sp. BFFFF2]
MNIKNNFPTITFAFLAGFLLSFGQIHLESKPQKWSSKLSQAELKSKLTILAADDMEGRDTGSSGQKKAGQFIVSYYEDLKIPHPATMDSYFQVVPAAFLNAKKNQNLSDSANILAFIEGTDLKEEIVVLSAHYDHIGIKNGQIHNGADDDGSGTVALMEIAKVLQMAKNDGKGPRRSVLIFHATGEEHGLLGSQYYSEHPVFAWDKTIVDINIDMIGRRDEKHNDNNGYVYLIGSSFLSSELHQICEQVNETSTKLDLDFTYNNKKDPNRFYYRSDHYNFAKNGVPSVFVFSGVHADYHQPTDDVEKIEFDAMLKRTQLSFGILWEVANRDKRLVVDGSN